MSDKEKSNLNEKMHYKLTLEDLCRQQPFTVLRRISLIVGPVRWDRIQTASSVLHYTCMTPLTVNRSHLVKKTKHILYYFDTVLLFDNNLKLPVIALVK